MTTANEWHFDDGARGTYLAEGKCVTYGISSHSSEIKVPPYLVLWRLTCHDGGTIIAQQGPHQNIIRPSCLTQETISQQICHLD